MGNLFKARQMYLLFIVILSVFLITGCGGGGDAVLGGGGGAIAPTVTAVVPLNKATGVAINIKTITATFSKAMASASLTTASFTLAQGGVAVVGGTVTYTTADKVATLTLPAGNLLASTLYTATITTAATDTEGTPLASNYVWTFTTGATADTTAPFVTATGVYGTTGTKVGATGLATNRVDTVTFNEAMNPLTITTTPSFTVKDAGIAVPGTVTYSVAGKTATFTPTGGTFAANTLFTSTVTTEAEDLAGNALAADYVWTWTTGAAPDTTAPTVTNTNPLDGAIGVCENKTISATFSEDINQDTLTNLTFTVAGKTGVISYDPITYIASFNPDTDFAPGTYTATIKGGASGIKDLAGNALAADKVWSFTTDTSTCAPTVNLNSATPFAIAAAAGVTNTANVPNTLINGDVVLDPTATCNGVSVLAAGTFGLCGGFAPTLNGEVISPLYPDAGVTSGKVMADLKTTYTSLLKANLPGATVLGCGTIGTGGGGGALIGCAGNATLPPGVYISATDSSIGVTGDLTLDAEGDANAQFIFQMPSSTLTTAVGAPGAPGSKIILINGAKASNVWWQVGSSATIGTYSVFKGNILADTSITMGIGSASCGRLLAGAITATGAFTFDSNTVSVPGNDPADPLCL